MSLSSCGLPGKHGSLSVGRTGEEEEEEGEFTWTLGPERYLLVIYLSVTVFTINAICVLPNIIIGSSDFHNYDSYTVVFLI